MKNESKKQNIVEAFLDDGGMCEKMTRMRIERRNQNREGRA